MDDCCKLKKHISALIVVAWLIVMFGLLQHAMNFNSVLFLIAGVTALLVGKKLFALPVLLILFLLGCIERHFICHYNTIFNKIGSQALITLQITDIDEIKTYCRNFFISEYILWILTLIVLMIFIVSPMSDIAKKIKSRYSIPVCLLFFAWFLCASYYKPIKDYFAEWTLKKEYYVKKKNWKFNAKSKRRGSKEFAILLIGESHRYDVFRELLDSGNVTPFLSNMLNSGELYFFHDIISPYPQTYFSVFSLLSRRNTDNINRFWPEKGLLALYKEAGWNVYYITYNDKNIADYGYDAVVNEAENYINHRDISNQKLDMGMLPIIKKILADNNDKTLIVIKMLGCHFDFHTRYTKNYSKRKPDGYGEKKAPTTFSPENLKKLKNAYYNAMDYSGTFIDKVFELAEKEQIPGFALFISDHGVINFDDGKNPYFGAVKSNYHLPCMLYFNPAYKKQYLSSEIANNLKNRLFVKLTNSYIFETMVSLSGIDYKNRRKELDVTSNEFQEAKERLIWQWNQVFKYDDLKQ